MSTHELSRPGIPDPLAFLHDGEIEVEGRMPWASKSALAASKSPSDLIRWTSASSRPTPSRNAPASTIT